MVVLSRPFFTPVQARLTALHALATLATTSSLFNAASEVTSDDLLLMEDIMMRGNLEIPKTALVLKAAPLAALILLLCGVIAHTILHPNAVVASGPTPPPIDHPSVP